MTAASFHLVEEVPLRLPFFRYYELRRARPFPFLLDSAGGPERLARYSFLGSDPALLLRATRRPRRGARASCRIELTEHTGDATAPTREIVLGADPFDVIRRVLAARAAGLELRPSPLPFRGGAVGYIGYDARDFIEVVPEHAHDDVDLPAIHLAFVDTVLGHDHHAGTSYLSVVGRADRASQARARAEATRDAWIREIAHFERDAPCADRERDDVAREADSTSPRCPPRVAARAPSDVEVRAHFDERAYADLVDRVKEHIAAGDAFEVCLTHRLESPFAGSPWALYRALRRASPTPFAALLELPEAAIVCSSPERFVRLDAARDAESRPIKGTRPRGASDEEDRALADDLRASPKDRAEHTMIVDLVRSDLGRVCTPGSVHVPELRAIESYATVHQMVSTIRGELEPERDAIDLLRATFPGGSMTGAPKIEAMKIAERLEPVKRGVYAGSIGYVDLGGAMDFNIVIRTMILDGRRALYGVGGAIVTDSEPRAEYLETMTKARALIDALAHTGDGETRDDDSPGGEDRDGETRDDDSPGGEDRDGERRANDDGAAA